MLHRLKFVVLIGLVVLVALVVQKQTDQPNLVGQSWPASCTSDDDCYQGPCIDVYCDSGQNCNITADNTDTQCICGYPAEFGSSTAFGELCCPGDTVSDGGGGCICPDGEQAIDSSGTCEPYCEFGSFPSGKCRECNIGSDCNGPNDPYCKMFLCEVGICEGPVDRCAGECTFCDEEEDTCKLRSSDPACICKDEGQELCGPPDANNGSDYVCCPKDSETIFCDVNNDGDYFCNGPDINPSGDTGEYGDIAPPGPPNDIGGDLSGIGDTGDSGDNGDDGGDEMKCINCSFCSYTENKCTYAQVCTTGSVSVACTVTCGNDSDCGQTHAACQRGACVQVPGPGPDQCSSDVECGGFYTTCENNACVTVQGSGNSTCFSGYDCADAVHLECVNQACTEVAGAAEDSCSSDDDCSDDTHLECVNQACTEVAGAAEDSCSNDDDCAEATKSVCDNNACISVIGRGHDECSSDSDCSDDTHLGCENNQCKILPGAKQNSCRSDLDCAPITHLKCINEQCAEVEGEGENECEVNADCVTSSSSSSVSSSSSFSSEIITQLSSSSSSSSSSSEVVSSSSSSSSSAEVISSSSSSSSSSEVIAQITSSSSVDESVSSKTESSFGIEIFSEASSSLTVIAQASSSTTSRYRGPDIDDDGDGDNDDGKVNNRPDDDNGDGDNDDGIAGNNSPTPSIITLATSSVASTSSVRLVAAAGICGNGVLEINEECDDTNRRNNDGCNAECLLEIGVCGDGRVQTLLGEQCEQATFDKSLPYSCVRCRFVSSTCGDGTVDPGEECDDGLQNSTSENANCRPDCSLGRCGDGVLDSSEICDDGNRANGDGCDRYCRQEVTQVASDTEEPLTVSFSSTPTSALGQQQQVLYQLPLAQLQPLVQGTAPVGDTGPAAVAVIGAGAAAGFSWMKRKR